MKLLTLIQIRLRSIGSREWSNFTSLMAVPRTFINASAGWLVELLGWTSFFGLCFVLAFPGMLLLLKVAPWNDEDRVA